MLYSKENKESYLEPVFGSSAEDRDIPKYTLGKEPLEPRIAYRLVKDELLDEGSARQNLATFCQTYMEDEATKLMSETLEKNAIDKSEYPRTAELENRCVNIIADLWHAPKDQKFMGTSTIGSSEACMLGGMAMKFAWRKRAEKLGLDIYAQKPNLVISSGYQVCWEKFCVYWDIDMRVVPMDKDHMQLNTDQVLDYVDEYTIGVVGILGITYTGRYDDIYALNEKLEEYNSKTDYKVYIHVDAASGGFFTPFVEPDIIWDFRLKTLSPLILLVTNTASFILVSVGSFGKMKATYQKNLFLKSATLAEKCQPCKSISPAVRATSSVNTTISYATASKATAPFIKKQAM